MAGKLGAVWGNTPKSTKTPVIIDLAWAAGFLEGEAAFNGQRIVATQKFIEPLTKLQHHFGGRIRQGNGRKSPLIFVWTVSGARARGVALTLFSFLSSRRRAQIKKEVI